MAVERKRRHVEDSEWCDEKCDEPQSVPACTFSNTIKKKQSAAFGSLRAKFCRDVGIDSEMCSFHCPRTRSAMRLMSCSILAFDTGFVISRIHACVNHLIQRLSTCFALPSPPAIDQAHRCRVTSKCRFSLHDIPRSFATLWIPSPFRRCRRTTTPPPAASWSTP